jgi:hypothetical protein
VAPDLRVISIVTNRRDIAPTHEWHGPYHETEYGFPLEDDRPGKGWVWRFQLQPRF